MSDKVIVSKQDANDLPYVEQEHSGDRYVLLEDVKHWLDQATPVSSEAVAWQFFQDGKWWNGSEQNNHKQNTIDAGFQVRELYTTPQPAPNTVLEGSVIKKIEWIDRAMKETTDSIKSDVLSIISEYESRFKKSLAKSLDDSNKAMKGE